MDKARVGLMRWDGEGLNGRRVGRAKGWAGQGSFEGFVEL